MNEPYIFYKELEHPLSIHAAVLSARKGKDVALVYSPVTGDISVELNDGSVVAGEMGYIIPQSICTECINKMLKNEHTDEYYCPVCE